MLDPVYALRKKRMEGMGMSEKPEVEGENPVPEEMGMKEYWDKIVAMDEKLDQILAAIGPEEAEMPQVPEGPKSV